MFLPSRQRRLNLAQTPDRVGVQPSLTRRGNIRPPSRGLKPTARFKAPRCGEEIPKSTWKAGFTYFPSAENKARFGDYFIKMEKSGLVFRALNTFPAPQNCPKLPKTAQNCPKLPKTGGTHARHPTLCKTQSRFLSLRATTCRLLIASLIFTPLIPLTDCKVTKTVRVDPSPVKQPGKREDRRGHDR